jgi:O-methyltransferase involved in polyketide biosynthesis
LLDEAVAAFLARHPGAVVLNLAAGLDTRYFRVGAPASLWIEVDLPGPMALRRQLIEPGDRHRYLAGSVLETAWLDAAAVPAGTPVLVVIEGLLMYLSREQIAGLLDTLATRFPGCEALVELVGRWAAGNTWWVRAVASTSAKFQGGVDAPAELAVLVPGVRVLETWNMLDHHWPRWGWMALGSFVPVLRHQHKLARLGLN